MLRVTLCDHNPSIVPLTTLHISMMPNVKYIRLFSKFNIALREEKRHNLFENTDANIKSLGFHDNFKRNFNYNLLINDAEQ